MDKSSILLLVLTPLHLNETGAPTTAKYTFVDKSGNRQLFDGTLTNEATSKYLISKSIQDNCPIKKVICIVTKKGNLPIGNFDSSYEMLKNKLAEYAIFEEIYQLKDFVKIDYDENAKSKEKEISHLFNAIDQEIVDENQQVYIDFTGGFRDISFLMISIMKYMKIKRMNCKEIVSSQYDRFHPEDAKIFSVNETVRLYDIISAIDEFNATGKTDALLAIPEIADEEGFQYILKTIKGFTNALKINNVTNIEHMIRDISNAINEYENSKTTSTYSLLLKTFIPSMKEGMWLNRIISPKTGNISFPDLVEWCLKHNLIQQAFVLYIEKLPKEYFDQSKEIQTELKGCVKKHNEVSEDGIAEYLYKTYMTAEKEFEKLLFKNKLQLGNYCRDPQKYLNTLKALKDKTTGKWKKPVENLYCVIDKMFFENKIIEFFPLTQKDFVSLLNYENKKPKKQRVDLENKKSELFQYLIYGQNAGFRTNAFEKKCDTLEFYHPFISDDLYNKLIYYLAVKILRNQVLHSNEDVDDDDQKDIKVNLQTINYFKEKNIDIDYFEYENVQKILYEAIEVARIGKVSKKKQAISQPVSPFVNLTNHPSSLWAKEQYDAALKISGASEIVDVPYPQINPYAFEETVFSSAKKYYERVKALNPRMVLVQGEMGFMFDLTQLLLKDGIKVVYACSERVTQENINENGETVRTSLFKFVRFREFQLAE